MREAPALAGVSGSRPRPNGARRPKSSTPKGGWHASLLGRAFRRPGVTIAGAAFAAVMTGIIANAILFQKGRHPAPLFGATHQPDAAPAKVAAALPRPIAAPAPQSPEPSVAAQGAVAPASPSAPMIAAPAAKLAGSSSSKAKAVVPHGHVDAIGRLIGTLAGQTRTAGHPIKAPEVHAAPRPPKTAATKTRRDVAQVVASPHN